MKVSKKCRHSIKALRIESKYHSEPDGYGGDSEWNWYELECSKCKKGVKIKDEGTIWHLGDKEYRELTGRSLDYAEIKKLFNDNKEVYVHANIPQSTKDALLSELGYKTPELARKIKAKKKLIKKHTEELKQMSITYGGGELDPLWDY